MSLGSAGFDDPITGNSREKFELLSLKIPLFSLSCSDFALSNWLGQLGQENCPLMPRVQLLLVPWIIPTSFIQLLWNFPLIRRCHMSTWDPLDSPCLTNYAPDTWHTVSHSKCAKCPALRSLPRKMCKFRLSRNSMKFYVIVRFRDTIPTVKSVSSSEI